MTRPPPPRRVESTATSKNTRTAGSAVPIPPPASEPQAPNRPPSSTPASIGLSPVEAAQAARAALAQREAESAGVAPARSTRPSTPPTVVTRHTAPPRRSAPSGGARRGDSDAAFRPRPASRSAGPLGLREPIYLASQLASICDVDLKTIHNWCDRGTGATQGGTLECFRTPGGHLRFRHSAVLRFLTRWGYPIPDSLLSDRPHLLFVEPDVRRRQALLAELELRRPGAEETDSGLPRAHDRPPRDEGTPSTRRSTKAPLAHAQGHELAPASGLFSNDRWYVHLWEDAYAALVAVGERTGIGARPDLAVLPVSAAGITPPAWMAAARHMREGPVPMRFVLLTEAGHAIDSEALGREPDVVGVVGRDASTELRALLDAQAESLLAQRSGARDAAGVPATETDGARPSELDRADEDPRRRRAPIAPREPIFVASQVAQIWNVDLKTVHNWVERGEMEAFCTPGRHLRFRRRSLLHFLRRYNMAIPEEVSPTRPRVVLVDADADEANRLAATLTDVFDVTHLADPIAALVELGAMCAGAGMIDAVVVSFPSPGVDDARWIEALSRHADTRYTRVVAVGDDAKDRARWQSLGAIATPRRDALSRVGAVLEQALGIETGRAVDGVS